MAMTFSGTIRELAGKLVGTDEGMRVHPLTWYRDDSASRVDMHIDDFMNVVLEEEHHRASPRKLGRS